MIIHVRNLILLFLLINSGSAFAQEIVWQNTIGGGSIDVLNALEQTADGGYICGGHSKSNISGDKTENCLGDYDFWVIKLDSTGNIQWQNTIGGNKVDELWTVRQTTDGGYICGGWSNSNISGDKTENSIGSYDGWVVKLDATGNIQWQNTIGGDSSDGFYAVYQTSDGGFICGGFSLSDISGDKTENTNGFYDWWVVKLDANGLIQWQNTIGGSENEFILTIKQTTDGGFICGGTSDSDISGDKSENCHGDYDFWIIKLDTLGDIVWQNTIGGSGDDRLAAILQTTEGGYICGGYTDSNKSGDMSENSQGVNDCWVLKLDANGNITWQNSLGGSDHDALHSLDETSDGGFIIGGQSASENSGDKYEISQGSQDYWVYKLDATGNVLWQNTIGSNGGDYMRAIQQTLDGDYILGGWGGGNISGDKTENNQGSSDFWVVKISDNFNLIQGTLYADMNANNIHDATEPVVPNKKITETNTTLFTISNTSGKYSLAVPDIGNYEVSPEFIPYYNPLPANHTSQFNSIHETDSLNHFAFQPTGSFNDLCVTITPAGPFRAGMMASYIISYYNQGTTALNPIIIFYPDSNVSFISASPAASTITADSCTWSIGTLNPFGYNHILVTVNVNIGLPIGTLINSGAMIEPIAGDANTSCNYSYWEVLTTGSFDPNDILVDRFAVYDYELSNPPWLEYIIRFQNTGNDTAFYARIDNRVPGNLQLNSFEMVSTSHPCNVEYQAYDSTMKFTFYNILLPDSNVNEPGSHGFVRYRMKPKSTLIATDSIRNSARIIFDYNAPVITNTAITEIIAPTSLYENKPDDLSVFPNPATGHLSLTMHNSQQLKGTIEIYDIYGQKIMELYSGIMNPGKWNGNFDISELAKGVYLVTVKGKSTLTRRIIKL